MHILRIQLKQCASTSPLPRHPTETQATSAAVCW